MPKSPIELALLTSRDLPGILHAAERTGRIGLLSLFATCDRWDIGGLSTPMHPDTGDAAWFISNGYPGGAGIAPIGYDDADRLLQATLTRTANAP